jgi:hypothetical protein
MAALHRWHTVTRVSRLGLVLVLCVVGLCWGIARAQDPPAFDWDKPFDRPQYLILIIRTNTQNGVLEDNLHILWPVPPDAEGRLQTPDGSGGVYHHEAEKVGGPFDTPREACQAALVRSLRAIQIGYVGAIPLDCTQCPGCGPGSAPSAGGSEGGGISGWWSRRSTGAKVAIVAGTGLLIIGGLAAAGVISWAAITGAAAAGAAAISGVGESAFVTAYLAKKGVKEIAKSMFWKIGKRLGPKATADQKRKVMRELINRELKKRGANELTEQEFEFVIRALDLIL